MVGNVFAGLELRSLTEVGTMRMALTGSIVEGAWFRLDGGVNKRHALRWVSTRSAVLVCQ